MTQQVFANRLGKSKSWVDKVALAGTLLIEAALSAATHRDATTARHLTARAARLAELHDAHPDRDSSNVEFGSTVVDLARTLIAANLGDNHQAITIHQYATSGDAWRRLPAEHRAAHLIDITRAYLDLGDPRAAGRALVTADRIAPAETRICPAARTVLTTVLRTGTTCCRSSVVTGTPRTSSRRYEVRGVPVKPKPSLPVGPGCRGAGYEPDRRVVRTRLRPGCGPCASVSQ